MSPVLFHGGLSLVPDNAVVVEIAPHALLQVCALMVILLSSARVRNFKNQKFHLLHGQVQSSVH